MQNSSDSPIAAFTCEIGEIIPDIEAPFYPPLVPSDEILEFIDKLGAELTQKILRGKDGQPTGDWYHRQIAANVVEGQFAHLKYKRLTPQSVAITDPDYGIDRPSPANLWVQPGFDAHAQPDAVVMTVFDGATRQLSVVASADQDFVLLHRRSGRLCCRFNTVDVVQGEGRVIGDGKTFAGYLPIPPSEMHGRVHAWHQKLGVPFGCGHTNMRGFVQTRRQLAFTAG